MTNSFPSVPETTSVKDSLGSLLERDRAALSCYSGSSEPPGTTLTPDMVGMLFVNTSTKELKQLTQLINGVATWTTILNFASSVPNQDEIIAGYQPKNEALTKLSALTPSANSIPYFTSDGAASIPTEAWARNFVASADTASARSALGVGTIGTKDLITNSDIQDGTITVEKLNPNLHIDSAGYDLGDIMETTAIKRLEDGWCPLCFEGIDEATFGKTGSGATVTDDSLRALYQFLYTNDYLDLFDRDGQSASKSMLWSEAWDGLYRLQLPKVKGRVIICGTALNICKTNYYTIYSGGGDQTFNFVSMNAYIRTK